MLRLPNLLFVAQNRLLLQDFGVCRSVVAFDYYWVFEWTCIDGEMVHSYQNGKRKMERERALETVRLMI